MTYSLPHSESVTDGFAGVTIGGTPTGSARRFEVNLLAPNQEILLHFQPRFDEKCIVRNNTIDGGKWQKEEREGDMPFQQGRPFVLELLNDIETGIIKFSIDGIQCGDFVVRNGADPSEVVSVVINGDLELKSVQVAPLKAPPEPEPETQPEPEPLPPIVHPAPHPHPAYPLPHPHPAPQPHPVQPIPPMPAPVAPYAPAQHQEGALPVPYVTPLDAFLQTKRFRIIGSPLPNAERFAINMKTADGEVLFHFNPRFGQNCVVRNHTEGHQYNYGNEERSGPCPFAPGRTFALDYIVGHDGNIRCFVDGAEFCNYLVDPQRFSQVKSLEINGDILLQQVLIA